MALPQLTREKIAEVFRTPEGIRTYEAILKQLRSAPEDLVEALDIANGAVAAATAAQLTADQGVLDAAAAQGVADSAQADIDAHVSATAAHGVTGAIVGTTDTQTLSGKTLDGATPLTGRTIGTGGATATLSANKPGSNAGVVTWLTISVNGTNYFLPLFG